MSESKETLPATPTRKPAAKKTPSCSSSGAFLSMLIALTAGGGSYYVWQQQLIAQQSQKALEQRIERLLKAVEAKDAAQMARIEQLAAPHHHTNLEQRLDELQQSIPQPGDQLSIQYQTWSLAEIDYLLQIAEQRLTLSRDIPTAIAALKQAQEKLIIHQGGNYSEIVAKINDQVNLLNSLKDTDFTIINARLSTIIDGLTALPFVLKKQREISPQLPPTQPTTGASLTERAKYWGAVIWHDIKSLVTIQRSDAVIQPQINSEQRFLLQEQLRLKLETARLAAMGHNQPLYSASIDEAVGLLGRYFDSSDNGVSSSQATLNELAAIAVAPELPSLQPLRQQLHATPLPDSSPPALVEEPTGKPL